MAQVLRTSLDKAESDLSSLTFKVYVCDKCDSDVKFEKEDFFFTSYFIAAKCPSCGAWVKPPSITRNLHKHKEELLSKWDNHVTQ